MQKIISKIIILVSLSVGLVSCEKFLEKDPIGRIGKNTLFEDVGGAELALNGTYNLLFQYYKTEFGRYADVASDNLSAKISEAAPMLNQFDFQSTEDDDLGAPKLIWQKIYATLNHVNNLLEALPALQQQFPKQQKTIEAIKGQALAIRALCHFDLCRVYAQPYNFTADASHPGIPLVLKTPAPGTPVARNSVKETYQQVVVDLKEALALLQANDSSNQYLFNYRAAQGLLSRVYLYMGDWDNCIVLSDEIIDDKTLKLATAKEYLSAFTKYPAGNENPRKEALFQLTAAGLTLSPSGSNAVLSDTSGFYYASDKMSNLFDATDIRKTNMFTVIPSGRYLGKMLTKKYGISPIADSSDFMIKVIRLSEVYLNRAEARWHKGLYDDAANDIEIISQRAHPNETISVTYNSQTDLYKQIADERNRELCFEGHRLFDINRRKEDLIRGAGCNSTVCVLTYPNSKFVLPINRRELDVNTALKQNPDYN